jgi:hypothetical protein
MANSRFDAETLTTTQIVSGRFELVLSDHAGNTHTVSLPVTEAADLLIPALFQLKTSVKPAGGPKPVKTVQSWEARASDDQPLVLLRFDGGEPLGLPADQAKNFWRSVREQTEAVAVRRPKRRH